MNQILSFEEEWKKGNKNGKRSPIDIKKIVIFFAICLIIFGIVIIGKAVYSMYGKKDNTENTSKPTVTITPNTKTGKLDITVKHDVAINKIIYSWDNKEETEIAGNNRNFINTSIEIPEKESKLTLKVIDVKNVSVSYEKKYSKEDIKEDVSETKIELTQGDGGVSVVVSAKNEISYITYKWNNEEEQKVEVNDKEYSTTIKVPQGENTLTVTAVDANGTKTEEQTKVQGIIDEKPTLDVTIDTSNFIITAKDDEGIEKVIIRDTNGEDTTIEVGEKEFEYKVPFIDGYNEIKILVYNVNGLTNYRKAIINK